MPASPTAVVESCNALSSTAGLFHTATHVPPLHTSRRVSFCLIAASRAYFLLSLWRDGTELLGVHKIRLTQKVSAKTNQSVTITIRLIQFQEFSDRFGWYALCVLPLRDRPGALELLETGAFANLTYADVNHPSLP